LNSKGLEILMHQSALRKAYGIFQLFKYDGIKGHPEVMQTSTELGKWVKKFLCHFILW